MACITGYSTARLVQPQFGLGFRPNYNIDPGLIYPPAIFEPPPSIATNEVWIAVTGGPLWGSASVYVSSQGDSYARLGSITKRATMGYLTADLPPGDDIDVANTLSVDLTESLGELVSVSTTDAASLSTLCWVSDQTAAGLGEFLSFTTATLTAANKYDLTGLYRGAAAWGSANEDHAIGSQFVRLDAAVAKFGYDSGLVGQTVYFKFPSVNATGGGQQDLADVTAYPFTLTGGTTVAFPVWLPFSFGSLAASEAVDFVSPGGVTFQPDFGSDAGYSSQSRADVAATASATFTIQKALAATPNTWTNIGTAVYGAGQVTATFTSTGSASQSLAAGDTLRIVAPASPDATLAGVAITLVGHRS